MTQAEAQQRSFDISREWYAGLDLIYGGVALGPALQYEIMSVLGRLFKVRLDTQPQEQMNHPAKLGLSHGPDVQP